MKSVEVTEADIEAARGGQQKILPLPGGGVAVLCFVGNAYRLTPIGRSGTIEVGEAPREGAVAETPPETPK